MAHERTLVLIYMHVFITFTGTLAQLDVKILTEECLTGICEYVPNYPEGLALDLVKELKASKKISNEDLLANTYELNDKTDSSRETPLCKSEEIISTPKAAQSANGTWYYILNPKYELIQRFRVEKCSSSNSRKMKREITSYYEEKMNFGICADRVRNRNYEGLCVQKYVLRQMMAISGNSVFYDYFRIPSCCSCVARSLE
ncbi:protein spaetzle-like [Colias croceus]|uniref:protein spaetzle-like n=1 Tax=Colias crocea TaxID=72248 RepID=UPI001E27ACD5|nr:protein spaetzle-like [Colias croceus]